MTKEKKNLIFYPVGTIGRDMVYSLFTSYIMLFILYTRELTAAQLGAITMIMVGARVFDALNDPIMGNIIERTRSRFGKFKPWMIIGILTTGVVIYAMFNTNLQGWDFIIFFGIIYFLYSITYTMHDISYWGMIPALSSNADTRDKITSRATLCAGIGGVIASIAIPLLTTGDFAIGGNAKTAYGAVSIVVSLLSVFFMLFTWIFVQENRDDMKKPATKISFKRIAQTIFKNDQLLWICIIFLIQETGNGITLGGIGTNYIYFEFGYEGGLYATFNTVGMLATAVLMVIYPMLSKRFKRKRLVKFMAIATSVGNGIMILVGLLMSTSMTKFWLLTMGFMMANFGQYGLFLIYTISLINTVEYNEYKTGNRDEAIITSMRPFLVKLASSLTVLVASGTYLIFKVTDFTNRISSLETMAEQGEITVVDKTTRIAEVISSVGKPQTVGLLLALTVLPWALCLISCAIYKKKYTLDEDKYASICQELNK